MKETLEILNQVNEFYNSAWEKLITVATVSFAIVGILVPLLIQWYQKKSMNLSEEKLQNFIKEEVEKNKILLQEEMKLVLIEEIQKFEDKITKIQNKSEGGIFHIQGNNMLEIKNYKSAVNSFIISVQYYFAAQDYNNLQIVLNAINEFCLDKINKTDILELKEEDSIDFEKILSEINDNQNTGACKTIIRVIQKKIKSLK